MDGSTFWWIMFLISLETGSKNLQRQAMQHMAKEAIKQ